jgi:hypothetical protein
MRAHDSVEIFQLVVLDSLNASTKFEFMDFWERVKTKTGKEPPYKDRFGQLNHMRVGFKHRAISPNLSELREVAAVIFPFFVEVCRDFLGVDFSKLSLVELVDDGAVRERLGKADDLICAQKYEEALPEIAIALHLVLSQKYPRSPWEPPLSALFDPHSSSHRPPRIRRSSSFNLLSGASAVVQEIETALEGLHDRVYGQAQVLEMLIWKIDLQRYG